MHEILEGLPEGARVLDLGSGDGSFKAEDYRLLTVRVDIARPRRGSGYCVQADAARLPFPSRTFDAVILNHSLEHFDRLKPALQEIGRVIKRGGAAFVAVPEARTIADRLYRKAYADRGGHVNLFASSVELATMLSWYLGLPHVATKILLCSYNFLNRRNIRNPALRRQMRFGGIWEPLLIVLTAALRQLDRWLGTRTTVYGWALYFGSVPQPLDLLPLRNVCVRCGQAHPAQWLVQRGAVRRKWTFLECYRCPACGASNFCTRDGT